MKGLLLILLLGLGIQGEMLAMPVQEQHDTTIYGGFDEAAWKKVVGNTDYGESKRKANFKAPSIPWAGPLLKIVGYIVIVGLVLWIFYYLITNIRMGARIQRTEMNDEVVDGRIENIETLDIEALLAQARREGNFRLAIRLYYLAILTRLHALGIIGWKKDKTNRDYLAELHAKEYHYADIRRLTVLYEAVWYGEHTPGAESFERLTDLFANMYQKINSSTT